MCNQSWTPEFQRRTNSEINRLIIFISEGLLYLQRTIAFTSTNKLVLTEQNGSQTADKV